MSCWRVLELSQPSNGSRIPQLLVKPDFRENSYVVHLTDLSTIWSEEVNTDGIVDRALAEQSPIEVSKHDPAQLTLLLQHVRKPLEGSDDTACRIIRGENGDIILHSIVMLPEPLEALTWKFQLKQRTSTTLKNELLLPLLISSHIQHERINDLIVTLLEKDRAITRLVDHFDSSNLDLAAAFPSVGSTKTGRKLIKREQAAKYVPALQPFREQAWRESTAQLQISDVTTLGLFREALAQNTPQVPPQLKAPGYGASWWSDLPEKLPDTHFAPRRKGMRSSVTSDLGQHLSDTGDEETEDEFETHDRLQSRDVPKENDAASVAHSPSPKDCMGEDSESTEDEDDLDAPIRSQSQNQPNLSPPRLRALVSTPPIEPKNELETKTKSSGRNFKIGGNLARALEEKPSLSQRKTEIQAPEVNADDVLGLSPPGSPVHSTPKKARRPFRIGGKARQAAEEDRKRKESPSIDNRREQSANPPDDEARSSPQRACVARLPSPVKEEEYEETPDEKAERKRAELKRKNEEAARKQAQQKKKKRF